MPERKELDKERKGGRASETIQQNLKGRNLVRTSRNQVPGSWAFYGAGTRLICLSWITCSPFMKVAYYIGCSGFSKIKIQAMKTIKRIDGAASQSRQM